MNLHYKKTLADVITNGKKIHTIRRRFVRPGTILKHIVYPYQRDKRKCLLSNVCVSCQSIKIVTSECVNEYRIYIDGRLIVDMNVLHEIAWNDGFISLLSFLLYFSEPFEGYIIHWTDKMY